MKTVVRILNVCEEVYIDFLRYFPLDFSSVNIWYIECNTHFVNYSHTEITRHI